MFHTTTDLGALRACGSRVSGSAHPHDAAAKFAATVRSHITANFDTMPPSTVDGPHVAAVGTAAARTFGVGALYRVIDHYPGAARPVRTLVVIDVDSNYRLRDSHPFVAIGAPAC